MLQLPESSEGVKGYTALCRAIVVLMSCGIDYTKQTENLHGRVLVRGEKKKKRALVNILEEKVETFMCFVCMCV